MLRLFIVNPPSKASHDAATLPAAKAPPLRLKRFNDLVNRVLLLFISYQFTFLISLQNRK